MKCPACGKERNVVTDSRSHGTFTHRRRKCMIKECGRTFTTVEIIANTNARRRESVLTQLANAIQRMSDETK